jgi:hypothetical protein
VKLLKNKIYSIKPNKKSKRVYGPVKFTGSYLNKVLGIKFAVFKSIDKTYTLTLPIYDLIVTNISRGES